MRKSFRRKSKKAYDLACKAIDATSDKTKHNRWRDIYGNDFPKYQNEESEAKAINLSYITNEEYIENLYAIDIRYDLEIDCEVKQNGYREGLLREFLRKGFPLLKGKSLKFYISEINIPYPYIVKWKVTNRGIEAIKRNCIRGQIFNDDGNEQVVENTSFNGEHFVECYIIKDGIVIAKDSIDVPISA